MKKTFIILIALAATMTSANFATGQTLNTRRSDLRIPPAYQAQQQEPSRWRLGGNIGFGISDDFTNINIAPKIGYALTQALTVGGGMSYNYYENKRYDFSENYFGMHLYASVHPIQYISIFVQPEGQRRWGSDRWGRSESQFLPCLLVGGGIVIPTGYRSSMSVTVYYDVIQDDYSPYGNRIGYAIGYTFRL